MFSSFWTKRRKCVILFIWHIFIAHPHFSKFSPTFLISPSHFTLCCFQSFFCYDEYPLPILSFVSGYYVWCSASRYNMFPSDILRHFYLFKTIIIIAIYQYYTWQYFIIRCVVSTNIFTRIVWKIWAEIFVR